MLLALSTPEKDLGVEDLLTQFDHLRPRIGGDGTPCAYYEAVRDEAARLERYVCWSERHDGYWVAVGHEECVAVARNPQAFSNTEPTFPRYATGEPLMIAGQDDPGHRFARALVNSPFGPNGVRIYDEALRESVNLLLMGLPGEHGPKFSQWVAAVAEGHLVDPEDAARKIAEMYAYFEDTIAARKRSAGDDLLSHVINAEVDGVSFTHEELLGFCTTLMLGGIDNTKNLLGTILWRLGWDVDLRARLVRDPTLIGKVVNEFLRYYSPAFTSRLILEDIELGGARMQAGQMLVMANPVANRDARAFPNPDAFIPDRTPNLHIGLGIGIHRCLGAHLLALEAKIVIEEFLKRLPDYTLDRDAPSRWAPGNVSGMGSVPITFTAGVPSRTGTDNLGVAAWVEMARSA
jgi:cytochrome P450